MSVSGSGARHRGPPLNPARDRISSVTRPVLPLVFAARNGASALGAPSSHVKLGAAARVSLMLTPNGPGVLQAQAEELLSLMDAALGKKHQALVPVIQTVFLRDFADRATCHRLFLARYGSRMPVTNYVHQPPCCGAALAIEAWAFGGKAVAIERFGPQVLAVSYNDVRWVYCGGIEPARSARRAYDQMLDALGRMRGALEHAGSSFDNVVRTWFYLGGITENEEGVQRYKELNRARTAFYSGVSFSRPLLERDRSAKVYPASTGIGMTGRGMLASCVALQTDRSDAFLLHLENPGQTPAYAYHRKYSPASPKFSRAIALVLKDYVTTWVSGTASIVDSESCHRGDIEAQTEQTIGNIERLIGQQNFTRHGVTRAGARLEDLAKIRVYLKRPQDFAACKAICDRRFGAVPAIYALADVCRPELLVEIEGVAFSRLAPTTLDQRA